MMVKCEHCKFFLKEQCLRYPPKVFVIGEPGKVAVLSYLPKANPAAFCGEFKAKE